MPNTWLTFPQPAFIDDDRSAAAHDAYSVLIFCKVLFDLTTNELWGHPDFEAFKIGYNMQVEYGGTSSRRFLSVSATSP